MQVNAVIVQREAQHVQHTARHIAEGIHPPAVLGRGEQPQSGEVQQRISHVEGGQGILAESLAAVIVSGGNVMVGEVAPAVSGGHQLAAHAALPLQQRHGVAVLRRRQRRHHPGGPAADHQYLHACFSNRFRVR